jgi:hypothetical protein
LWLHNPGVAFTMLTISRAMPREMGPEEDQIILAGMLHDIGFLALAMLDPKRSDALHAAMEAAPEHLLARMIFIAEKIMPSLGMAEHVSPVLDNADWQALGIDPDDAEQIIAQTREDSELALQFAVDVT